MLSRSVRSMMEVASTAMDVVSFRYPGFVYGAGVSGRAIPVFCFHEVEPVSLEAMLAFLSNNGYVTLDADEYCDILTQRAPTPARAVMLTFDDGWGSLWSVGFPLIKKYDAKIVVFIPPGRIEHRRRVWPNLDDPESAAHSADVLQRDQSEQPFLAWEEIAEMHDSGLVDFQSHSYSHSLVYKSSKVVEFANPNLLETCSLLEIPSATRGRPVAKCALRLGEPLYETTPGLSDVPAVEVDPRVAEDCSVFVRENGGRKFFDSRYWRIELERLTEQLLSVYGAEWRTETPEEQLVAIRFELDASKRLIEEMLPGKTVRHICYPWHVAGKLAFEESLKAGYEGCFWGKVDRRYCTALPGDPFRVARVGSDFFFRLPGRGRVSLLSIFLRKIARRAREGTPYLTH